MSRPTYEVILQSIRDLAEFLAALREQNLPATVLEGHGGTWKVYVGDDGTWKVYVGESTP